MVHSRDTDTVEYLNQRVESFDPDEWVMQHQHQPGWPQPRILPTRAAAELHNPYAGVPYAWQLSETVDEFLARLPPATTDQTLETPWIFICNPYIPRVPKSESLNQTSKGNEDEGPEQEGSRFDVVIEGGMERLELLGTFLRGVSSFGKPPSATEREKNKERAQATRDILQLAHVAKVRAGKWMLFCDVLEVNEVWDIVAKATASNELGIAAKVAPRAEQDDRRKERLICVYTQDFLDKVDIGRVVKRLKQLGLTDSKTRRIYYKPDVFTYLGIAGGNPWGLKASIYNSAEEFPSSQDVAMTL
ncbi:Translation Initiation factor eIF- 4e-like domain protein [Cordyceps fumosorosea ARSEF 2679]|uniref:Translation Initiation factor eIF-4e-like domain protein n=1 Tax=Cordyceps fumosorosea (strain ARSEF 2679) TaxID=1081104 RepID=A0A168ECY8_CORFA|nr:Translation Initiation factor eIF- 4e-like domain protein [Cordyceps fumosorosea ARSEF 2679]OAA73663.1 Translation Initiation factor eIF- 4e-like domain protein [Cordyceps fumosorosea ARSEF 2679]